MFGTYNAKLMAMMWCIMLTTCDFITDDDRCCCRVCHAVDFRYLLRGADEFDTYISSMQYFLFDATDGHYVGELTGDDADLSIVSLDGLWAGSYSLVGVGNLVDYGSIEGLELGLDSLHFSANQAYDADILANGDRLYWGQCDFTLTEGAATQTFTGEMANVHCRLAVRVIWEWVPDYADGYAFELVGIGEQTELCATHATTLYSVQQFPPVSRYEERMRVDVPLRQFALQAELITLRYTNDDIPTFRLLHDGEPVFDDIDLCEVFAAWEWWPDVAWVQDYEMLITVLADGRIQLSEGLSGDILDWEDGGTLG